MVTCGSAISGCSIITTIRSVSIGIGIISISTVSGIGPIRRLRVLDDTAERRRQLHHLHQPLGLCHPTDAHPLIGGCVILEDLSVATPPAHVAVLRAAKDGGLAPEGVIAVGLLLKLPQSVGGDVELVLEFVDVDERGEGGELDLGPSVEGQVVEEALALEDACEDGFTSVSVLFLCKDGKFIVKINIFSIVYSSMMTVQTGTIP